MNRLRIVPGLAAFAMAAPAGVIVKDRQYRFCEGEQCKEFCSGKQPACVKPAEGVKPLGLVVTPDSKKYTMTFIEYKEDGTPWDWAQFEQAKKLIEEARKGSAKDGEKLGPATVFLYVHGWKNNADDRGDDADVARFGRYLDDYHDYVKNGDPRPVIGVYLAWRGRSLELPGWISWTSFWTRSLAARRVGGGVINDHIDGLLEIAVRHRGELPTSRHPYAFVIGHSFGARVLETAVIGRQPNRVNGACKTLAEQKQAVTAPADVVLFENAATSAGYVRRQLRGNCQPCRQTSQGCADLSRKPDFSDSKMARQPDFEKKWCQEHPKDRRCQPYTLFMAVSSSKDWLTRGLLFVAAFQHPAAFFPSLQTHRIDPSDGMSPVDPAKDEVFLFETPDDIKAKKAGAIYLVRRKNLSTVSAANPVWVVEVGKAISASHGDVWNGTMMNMLVNLAAADGNMHSPTAESPAPPPPQPLAPPPAAGPPPRPGLIRQTKKMR